VWSTTLETASPPFGAGALPKLASLIESAAGDIGQGGGEQVEGDRGVAGISPVALVTTT